MKRRFPFKEGQIISSKEWGEYLASEDTLLREERPEEGLIYNWDAKPIYVKNLIVKYEILAYKEAMDVATLALYEMSKGSEINRVVQNEIDRLKEEVESLSSACQQYRDLIAHQTMVMQEAINDREVMQIKMIKMRDAYEEEIEMIKSLAFENERLVKEMNKFAAQNGLIVVNDPETGQISLIKEKKEKSWFRVFA